TNSNSQHVCNCKVVSIFIFREGGVLITGAQSWKQVMDAYDFLLDVVDKERLNVQTHFDLLDQKKKKMSGRNMAIRHEDCVYLNKFHLLSNPRNFLLLKKLGYLNAFQE
ncbi:MAG: hypothetical protein WD512_04090, partial [Candidatus Paceibacterota bacterium]